MTGIESKSRWTRRAASLGALLALVFALAAFAWWTTPEPTDLTGLPGTEPLRVSAERIEIVEGYTVTREFIGRVEAAQASDLGFELGGLIARVAVDEGDVVAAGAVIARLDTDRLEARRDELVATRDQARANLELAIRTRDRLDKALAKNAVSKLQWDEADQGRVAREADLERAEAAIRSVDVDIDKAVLTSPYDAVVARRFVDDGRVVEAGVAIVTLLERRHPEVRLGVAGGSVEALREGSVLDVRVRDRVIAGSVATILPTRDSTSRGVDVRIVLDAEINGIRQGDLARVEIERFVAERGAWVPLQALTEGRRGLWSLSVVDPDEDGLAVLAREDVEAVHTESDRVFVRTGLVTGTAVVGRGLHRVVPGLVVRPIFDREGVGTAHTRSRIARTEIQP